MQYRIDLVSKNQLSALGFGCMRFPKNYKETEDLIIKAIEAGVNYFDTAYIYAKSEETLGKILKEHGLREKIYLATKLPLVMVRKTEDFDKFFNKQLENLQTDYIDYYLMHMITSMAQWEEMISLGIEDWIKEKKAQGKIRQIGFSFHGAYKEFEKILNAYDWEFCQIQYNYSDENYQAGVKGLKLANRKEIPVIIMEPLLGGKLATLLPPEAKEIYKEADGSSTPVSWALRWLYNQPEVTVVLSGMNQMSQLEENINTASTMKAGTFTDKEIETMSRVREVFKKSNKVPCTGCAYCMPCPRHVDIPACFSTYNTSYIMGKSAGTYQYITGTGTFASEPSRASLCVGCRACETHCPQGIKISEELINVKKRLEPWWYGVFVFIARKVLGRK